MIVKIKPFNVKKKIFWIASWIGSMFLFAYIFVNKNVGQSLTSVELLFVFLVTIFGIVSFTFAILDVEKAIKQNHSRIIGGLLSILAFFLSLGIGIGVLIFAFYILPKPQNNEVQADKTNDVSIQIPSKINTPTVQNTTVNNVDTNPYVNCTVNEKCGGGYRYIRKSECSNSTCCEVDGKWSFYTSRDKCNQDQQAYNNSHNNSSTNNSSSQTTTTNYTFPTTLPQKNTVNSTPQSTVDNTSAREQCISSVNSALNSAILNYRNYCRANGCDNTAENERLNNEASAKRAQCYSMYP